MRPLSPLAPALRAFDQLSDPVFWGVLWRSVAWALGLFVLLAAGIQHWLHVLLGLNGLAAGFLGGLGALALAHVLFLPVAGLVASLFADRIAAAVERRFYPAVPPARPAPWRAQVWDGVVLGVSVLLLQLASLLLSPLLGVSLPVGWAIAAWAIGRGLFVAVAMRRMERRQALAFYRARRPLVLFQGLLIAAGSLVPLLNLLVPVLGVAAMTHVFHGRMEPDHGVVAPEARVLGPAPRL